MTTAAMTDPTSLQNLHPIVLPPEVGVWPPAPGWYLVLTVLLLMSGRLLWLRYRKLQANRYRFEAKAELLSIQQQKNTRLKELPLLVKSTALKVYPRKKVASLHGEEWLRFLDTTIESDRFSKGPGRLLPELSYSSPEKLSDITDRDLMSLFVLVEYWLLNHQVPTGKGEGENV